jgi:hypothetical protein
MESKFDGAQMTTGKKTDAIDREALKRWLGDTKVVGKDGEPLVVYRGEHGDVDGRRFQSRLGSISFGSAAAASTYSMSPNNRADVVTNARVLSAYLKIEKPFINDPEDPFIDLGMIERVLGTEEANRAAVKFKDYIENTNNWEEISEETGCKTIRGLLKKYPERMKELYFDAYAFFDNAEYMAKLKALGFDGAIHMGSGETFDELEYKVFDESQIRSATTPWIGIDAIVRRLTADGMTEEEATAAVEAAVVSVDEEIRLMRQDRVFVHVDDLMPAAEIARSTSMNFSPRI